MRCLLRHNDHAVDCGSDFPIAHDGLFIGIEANSGLGGESDRFSSPCKHFGFGRSWSQSSCFGRCRDFGRGNRLFWLKSRPHEPQRDEADDDTKEAVGAAHDSVESGYGFSRIK